MHSPSKSSAGRPLSSLHIFSVVSRVLPFITFVIFATLAPTACAQAKVTSTPFVPPALPLLVRSPYLSSWLRRGSNPPAPGAQWPGFWTATAPNILGWYTAIQVDGQTYSLVGDPADPAPANLSVANLTATLFTPTQTVLSYTAGPMNVNLSYLNPITPGDLLRQSLPFSYFHISASSTTGTSHSVQVYSDISGEWITGDTSRVANWTSSSNGDIVFHGVSLQTPEAFSEIDDHPMDATAWIGMSKRDGTTWKINADVTCRGDFSAKGQLDNTIDNNFRPVSQSWPVFAISTNLGSITSTSQPVVWALGILRDPAIQYITANNTIQKRRSYFWSQYPTVQAVMEFFLNDFPNALDAASALDSKIQSAALNYSPQYYDLLSLSLAQAMGASDITLSVNGDGSLNTSDVLVFVKNLGGVGAVGVNRIDSLYALMPAYLYLDPSLFSYILESHLRFQDPANGLYPNPYAAIDLGGAYPNATGNPNPHAEGVETSADMLIMVLAQAQASGNGTLIGSHYDLLKSWGNYLVQNALAPGSQTTSDSIGSVNQTNLALKGIIGVGAMAKISDVVGASNDSAFFEQNAQTMIGQWTTLASNGANLASSYGNSSSSGLMYNLYADALLQLGLVPANVYTEQSTFYASQLASSQFGLAIDSAKPLNGRTDWMLLAAAAVPDSTTRNLMVSQVHSYAAANVAIDPWQVIYEVDNGHALGGIASPNQGAVYGMLALNQTIKDITLPNGSGFSSGGSKKKTSTGVIAGAVVASVLGILIIGALVFVFIRRRRRNAEGIYAPSLLPYSASATGSRTVLSDSSRPGPGYGYSYEAYKPGTTSSGNGSQADMREGNGSAGYSVTYPSVTGSTARTAPSSGSGSPPATAGLPGLGGGVSAYASTGGEGGAVSHSRGVSVDTKDSGSRGNTPGSSQGQTQGQAGYVPSPLSQSSASSARARGAQRALTSAHVANRTSEDGSRAMSPMSDSQLAAAIAAAGPSNKDGMVSDELRLEVANLRREMERMREEQREREEQQRLTGELDAYPASEAPPEYTPDAGVS